MIRAFILLLGMLSSSVAFSKERVNFNKEDLTCLATNIYFEAKNQSVLGQMAVAYVTLNRVKHSNYPDTICEVVKQAIVSKWHLKNTGKIVPIRNKCQFSWYCDGRSDKIKNKEAYNKALEIAGYVLMLYPTSDITDGSTHYHANYVNPKWNRSLKKVVSIEEHIFYK